MLQGIHGQIHQSLFPSSLRVKNQNGLSPLGDLSAWTSPSTSPLVPQFYMRPVSALLAQSVPQPPQPPQPPTPRKPERLCGTWSKESRCFRDPARGRAPCTLGIGRRRVGGGGCCSYQDTKTQSSQGDAVPCDSRRGKDHLGTLNSERIQGPLASTGTK